MSKEKTIVDPFTFEDPDTDTAYTLEFDLASVKFADLRGFVVGEVQSFPASKILDLWFFAFRKNHQKMTRAQTDKLYNECLGGLTAEELVQIIQLYNNPINGLIRNDGDGAENPIRKAKIIS